MSCPSYTYECLALISSDTGDDPMTNGIPIKW